MTETVTNTDREIWRETEGDYYAPSIHATELGGIGINVGGMVHVLPVREWHKLALRQSGTRIEGGGERYPTADREYEDIDDPRKTGLADLMEPESPTPEHVEGDVLSVEKAASSAILDCSKDGSGTHHLCFNSGLVAALRAVEPILTSATTRIQQAEREIARCHERLEIDHVFVMGATAEDDLVRQDIPMSERHEMPDAVECRDATISLLEQDLKAAEAQLADAVKVLEPLANMAVPPKPQGNAGFYSVRHSAILAARTFLSTIGEKPDAE